MAEKVLFQRGRKKGPFRAKLKGFNSSARDRRLKRRRFQPLTPGDSTAGKKLDAAVAGALKRGGPCFCAEPLGGLDLAIKEVP